MHNLQLRHRLSRLLHLVMHSASSRRQSARLWARTSHWSNMRSLSTASRAADKDLSRRCRIGLPEWLEEPALSDGPQGRGFEPRRCHPCSRKAQRGKALGCAPRGDFKTAWPTGRRVGVNCFAERARAWASCLSAMISAGHDIPRATSLFTTSRGLAKKGLPSARGSNSKRQSVKAWV